MTSEDLFDKINETMKNPALDNDTRNLLALCRAHLGWLDSGRDYAQLGEREANARADLLAIQLEIAEKTSAGFQAMVKSMATKKT